MLSAANRKDHFEWRADQRKGLGWDGRIGRLEGRRLSNSITACDSGWSGRMLALGEKPWHDFLWQIPVDDGYWYFCCAFYLNGDASKSQFRQRKWDSFITYHSIPMFNSFQTFPGCGLPPPSRSHKKTWNEAPEACDRSGFFSRGLWGRGLQGLGTGQGMSCFRLVTPDIHCYSLLFSKPRNGEMIPTERHIQGWHCQLRNWGSSV